MLACQKPHKFNTSLTISCYQPLSCNIIHLENKKKGREKGVQRHGKWPNELPNSNTYFRGEEGFVYHIIVYV